THRVVVYFILSKPDSVDNFSMLQQEQQQHCDLIMTDLTESYKNLVYKVYASFMFHQHYCPQTLFLMKVDDDVCIDIDRILTDWNIEKNGSISSIYCHKAYKGPAVRDPKHKLFVPKHIWPMPYFPTYCGGPAYIMGRSAEQAILDEARNFPPFYIEDVFYTGILAESIGIERVDW
ncbi:hypothetical protein Angca_005478, partial [Angiostrongylus cantonensis]